MTAAPTVETAIARALEAYAALTGLGEEVEDEWTYVTDLSTAWTERLEAVVAERGGQPIEVLVDDAVERLIEEVGTIDDPHRAIDWLSTFPQVVLLALGEPG